MTPASRADRLGKVFCPVKSDIVGNIKKLQNIAKTKPNGVTLQALVREEKATGGIQANQDHPFAQCATHCPALHVNEPATHPTSTHKCAMNHLGRSTQVGGAGDSLLWLKRAMQFMTVFLDKVDLTRMY